MQIVIDIPEDVIESAKSSPNYYPTYHFEKIWRAIVNGTPLPKGHGDLITKEQAVELVEFYQMNPQHFNFVDLKDEIKDEKAIIEADKESEENG